MCEARLASSRSCFPVTALTGVCRVRQEAEGAATCQTHLTTRLSQYSAETGIITVQTSVASVVVKTAPVTISEVIWRCALRETNMATTHMCPTDTTHQLTGKLHDSLDESRQAFATVQVLDSNGRGADTRSCSPSCGTNFDRDGTHTLRWVGTSGVPGKSLKPILTTTAGTPLSPNLGSVIVSFSDGDSPQVPVQQASRLHRGLSSHSAHAWCPSVHWQRWLCFVPSHGSLPVRRCSEHGSAV